MMMLIVVQLQVVTIMLQMSLLILLLEKPIKFSGMIIGVLEHLHGILSESEPVDPCADLVDANEPNDTMADATDASAGGTYTAILCPTTDLDMYMVNAVAGGTISLTTACLATTLC